MLILRRSVRALRASLRLVTATVITLFFFGLWLVGSIPVSRSRRLAVRWRSLQFRSWSRALLWLLGVEVAEIGRRPEPPFFLVVNHLSYVDILVLASRVDAFFIAKSEVEGWPAIGLLCRSMGTIFIDRGSRRDVVRVLDELEGLMAEGHGVVLFPEGTSTDGTHVRRFLPSLLDAAARMQRPVAYASLRYETPAGEAPSSEVVCWWGEMTFGPHVWNLMTLPGFRAHLHFGEETILHDDRKQLAARLRDAVIELLPPGWDSAASCR